MKPAQITYGEASKVADYLSHKNSVTHEDLVGALINALSRVHTLEKQVNELKIKAFESPLI